MSEYLSYDHWRDCRPEKWVWPNFTPMEMACRGSGKLWVSVRFMNKIQSLRAVFGRAMPVSSGYRSPIHNAAVSSTGTDGPHTTGHAADFALAGDDAFRVLELAIKAGHMFTGIGVKQKGPWSGRFLHLDDLSHGDHPRPRLWSY